jgi:hypothetical protein
VYVAELLLCCVGAEVINSPLNYSVVIVKERLDTYQRLLEKNCELQPNGIRRCNQYFTGGRK